MKKTTISEKIANFILKTNLSDIPNTVVRKSKLMLLDFFASALAGYDALGAKEIALFSSQYGSGKSTIIGYRKKTSPPFAALANGVIAHALDYDDTHSRSILHPTVTVAPAILALGEDKEVSGKEILTAFIVGVETSCKLGLSCTLGPFQTGFIYTSLIGTYGASAASAKILKLDFDNIINTLGIAYSFTSGNAEQLIEGTLSKRLQAGIASMNGVTSALLASAGFTGAREAFEGKYGFFNTYLKGSYNLEPINKLGKDYEIPSVSFKPYPCCRLTHTSIDATLKLRRKYNIHPQMIKEIIVKINKQAYNANAEPIEVKRRPRNIVDAQFSIPYTVSCALLYGKISIRDFTKNAIKRSKVLEIAEKITPIVDKEIEEKYGREISPAIVDIKLKNGKNLIEKVIYPLGEKQNPMNEKMLVNKFLDAVEYSDIISIKKAEEIVKMILSLEKIDNIKEILRQLTRRQN